MRVSARRVTQGLLVVGCLAGMTTYLLTPFERPDQLMLATDVYYHAVTSFLDGGPLYGTHPAGRSGYTFLYPPITILAFLPHVLLGSSVAGYVFQTVLNVGATFGTGVIILRGLERRSVDVTHIDRWLIGAFLIVSTYVAIQFINGQVNLWLALALAVGFDAIDRGEGRRAGIAFAVAALFKVFPAIVGLWLLRLRAWRAIGAALVTGLAGLVLGVLLFGPDLTITYLTDVLLARFEGETYDGQPAPDDSVGGIHRQLAAMWPGGAALHTLAGLVIIGGLLAGGMAGATKHVERDAGALAVIVSVLLFLPVQPLYFPFIAFPLFMLLYADLAVLPRRLLLAGTLLTIVHVEQRAVELTLEVLPFPATIAGWIESTSGAIFTVILPPTLGLWILLLATIAIQFTSPELSERRTSPATLPV